MYKIFGSFLIILTLLAGCGSGGGSGGGGNNNIQAALATNADLSDLTLSAGPLDQAFQANQTSYTATVGFLITVTTVTPTTDDANATVTVNGVAVISGTASGSISLDEGPNTITVIVTAEDGTTTRTYTIDVDRETAADFAEQAYLRVPDVDAEEDDWFGGAVALSGDTLAVGAVGKDSDDNLKTDVGAIYVFTRDNDGEWGQQDLLRVSDADAEAGDEFGFSVSLSGDTLAVGAVGKDSDDNLKTDVGAVYVFTRDNDGEWGLQDFLRASNAEAGDEFGFSVSLSGDALAVGAVGKNSDDNLKTDVGAVYVFTRNNDGEWGLQDFLRASNAEAGDQFGFSVSLSGDALAVGAVGKNSDDNLKTDVGAVYVFTRNNEEEWDQQDFLRASNAEAGDDFGFSVSLSGDTLAIGAVDKNSDDNLKTDVGAVYVFIRDNEEEWGQQDFLRASNAEAGDFFGGAVALSGDTLAVGAVGKDSDDDSKLDVGAVYVFQ
jgi:sorbitol-specific phosphotransferase system component IIA